MKITDKIMKMIDIMLEIFNESVLIILLEFSLFLDSIMLQQPKWAILWITLAVIRIIILLSDNREQFK